MSLDVEVQVVTDAASLPQTSQLSDWAQLAYLQNDAASLVIRIVDSSESRELNRQYRHKDSPTNVLSFPFDAPSFVTDKHLGDLVICASVVAQEAMQQNKSLEHHWAHLVIHGMLHLQGYDHIEEQQAYLMESKEIALLAKLNINNPYEA